MIRIELRTPRLDGHAVQWDRLALIEAEGRELKWYDGDESVLDFDIQVIDLRGQRSLKFEDDPEEWVRGLPTIFRNGDIVINVLEDTNPLPSDLFKTPTDGDEPIDVEPVETHSHRYA